MLPRKRSFCSALSEYAWLVDARIADFLKKSAILVKGKILDFGCGNKPYYNIFKAMCDLYVGLDISQSDTLNVDVINDFGALPFRNETFDAILCTQVLEHVKEPDTTIGELSRVLKSKGVCIVTVPQIGRLHEIPNDYYRFTRYGIEYLFKKNKLNVVEIKPIGGMWASIGLMILSHFACAANASYGILNPWKNTIKKLINRFFNWLDTRYPDDEDTIGYMIIAYKI